MKKLIIWDFDGPIIGSREIALELTQRQYHDVTEDIHRNLFNGNIFTELSKLKKKDVSEEEYADFLEKNYWPRKMEIAPVEGIGEVLATLSRDFDMVINSASSSPKISHYLEKNNFTQFFSKVYGNEIKSKEEKFRLILEDFKISSQDCVLITDTLGDVVEASAVNISSIVVLWGYQLKEHFASVSEKVVFVESVNGLAKAIEDYFSTEK